MLNRLTVLSQYLIPKQAITAFAGYIASYRGGVLTSRAINWFVQRYGVDMDEAANSNIHSYASFNDFFTRALKPGARPMAKSDLICPVDGAISQFGKIRKDQIFQAKGHEYSINALVGGHCVLAEQFLDGCFATLYLSPRDYHRIHMPCPGRLVQMIYIPGSLFSVNPSTARAIPGLFARNERIVCVFESANKFFLLVLVGATIVGSMATVWHGRVNPPRPGQIRQWEYADQNITLKQGEEMGRFLLGSTVVMVFPASGVFEHLKFNPQWSAGKLIKVGESMANTRAG